MHAHFGPNGCAMVPVTKALGVPLVTSLYGVDAAVLPYLPQWRDQYARLFRDGDLFLAEGPEMRKKIIAAGAPADRTVIHPIALDLLEVPALDARRPRRRCSLSAVSSRRRGCSTRSPHSAARTRASPAARMTIVGGGPDEAAARALVDRLRLDAASWSSSGMQPHADVIRRLADGHGADSSQRHRRRRRFGRRRADHPARSAGHRHADCDDDGTRTFRTSCPKARACTCARNTTSTRSARRWSLR